MQIEKPGGHLDQLIRQTRAHHVQLSTMADFKANMLMTMAALVVTFTVPRLMHATARLPLAILVGACLLTITLAAYASMPKLPFSRRLQGKPDVHARSFNLLFFTDFLRLSEDEYEAAWEDVLNDTSRIYEVQVREIRQLGQFLAFKKYRVLQLAYACFLAGLTTSAVVFVVADVH